MKKRFRWVKRLLLYPVLALVGLVALLSLSNLVTNLVERGFHPAPGQMVEVGGKKIHVFSAGKGEVNVVLLSGLGTRGPVIDFAPLTRELQAATRVTVVEYPGYGWSDDTSEPRTTAASVEETRQALAKAGILPPYVLVAHSISGLQALYWASRYPAEVSGLVGLDSSLPGQLPYMPTAAESVDPNAVLGALGLVRIALWLDPSLSGAQVEELTPQEVRDFAMLTNWNIGSRAIGNEGSGVVDNLRAVQQEHLPAGLPVTFVLASRGVAQDAPVIPGAVWLSEHQKLIQDNPNGKVLVLEGEHYIHHHHAKDIANIVIDVIDRAKAMKR